MTSYSKHRFHVLDGMRGIAAIIVMIFHYYISSNSPSPLMQNAYIAVDFFFILSGFVIMHSYGGHLANGMPAATYIGHRIIRLYPLMALGTIMGVPSLLFYSVLGYSDYPWSDIIASALSNLTFLPYMNDHKVTLRSLTIMGQLFPADGPLWSIFFEVVASIAFIWMAKASTSSILRCCCAGLCAIVINGAFGAFVGHSDALETGKGWATLNFFSGFPRVLYGFSCGVLLYKMRAQLGSANKENPKWQNLGTAALYIVLVGCLLFPYTLRGFFYLMAIAVIAPALVWLGSNISYTTRPFLALSQFLGWLSYPLYCLHFPVLIAFYAMDEKFAIAARAGVSAEALAIGTTFILAVASAKFFDEPVRRWLTRRYDDLLNRSVKSARVSAPEML